MEYLKKLSDKIRCSSDKNTTIIAFEKCKVKVKIRTLTIMALVSKVLKYKMK